jgi:histone H3/H4
LAEKLYQNFTEKLIKKKAKSEKKQVIKKLMVVCPMKEQAKG